VYAAGDAAAGGGLPLTPIAGTEGEIVAENLLKGNHRKADFLGLANMAYTIPPLASAGLNEAQADAQGLKYRVNEGDMTGWYSSRRLAVDVSAFKVLVEEGTDRILGAHILGPHAEEQINVLALAIRNGIPAARVKEALYAYPTGSSDLEYMV
jgi:glutathione reductase (NADPH)